MEAGTVEARAGTGSKTIADLLPLAAEAGSAVVERYREAERLERAALLELPVDVLCPCARYHSIHAGNAERLLQRKLS